MRVSAQTQAATRTAILKAARQLFAANGYEATLTRDIAHAAGIASGTLFNYFQTKEAIVAALVGDAIGDAHAQPDGQTRQRRGATFEEDLFALIAIGLRKLKPLRKHLPALLETSLSPLADAQHDQGPSLRVSHLEAVAALAASHGFPELSPIALQLHWTLYTGVLAFWASDRSPKQEDTLALIDDSINMFVGWMRQSARTPSPPAHR